MSQELLIVESPAKSKTISKFLGDRYRVLSSYGHIRDLKTKGMGVDIDKDFSPLYEITDDKEAVVKQLKKAAKNADKIWLASDEDREGEAIAWHLAEVLDLDTEDENRIVFHEITQNAIQNALKSPRKIDLQMVDAQQARRILDRIVGFELSPVLWHKVRPSLSAGRVQSVALRILVEREREIHDFTPESSFRVRASFVTENGDVLEAEMDKRLKTVEEAREVIHALREVGFRIESIEVKPAKRQPAPPFTTSTLQQEASRKLGFGVGQTMRIAQKLYEEGHITYMRTDSVNLSKFAIAATAEQVEQLYGKEYVKTRNFKTKSKGAQEAHEAIRPTHLERVTVPGNKQEKAIYDLIRKRTMATQMADAELERTTIGISSDRGDLFNAKGEVVKFDGFLKVYLEDTDEEPTEGDMTLLPEVSKGQEVKAEAIYATERFTQRPARYTEASLVKKMEELGIGRPSTYAPTIQTIQKRGYVEKKSIDGNEREYIEIRLKGGKVSEKKLKETYGADRQKLMPTDVGIVVNDFLVANFPEVMDYNFTAKVEEKFDQIAEGKEQWHRVISDFYALFHENVEDAMSNTGVREVGERLLGKDPESGLPIISRLGKYGPLVQMGTSDPDSDQKPKYAAIPASMSMETITLEEALELFRLPRKLGTYEGEPLEANIGRFGPYVRVGRTFASIPKDLSLYDITEEQAGELIQKKLEAEKNKTIATFGAEGEEPIRVLSGRFGPYISYKRKNYRLPKDVDAAKLTESEVREIIDTAAAAKKNSPKKTTVRKSTKKK